MEIFELELAPVLDQAAGQIQPLVDSRGLEIRVDAGGRPWVRADRRRLLQVLWNLLSNAVKFTPKGGRVQVLLERINSQLEISVIDTGEGIKPEFLPYVFDRFRHFFLNAALYIVVIVL